MTSMDSVQTIPHRGMDGPLLGPGSYRLRAVHLGSAFDLLSAARETGGLLAAGRAYLFVQRMGALHFLFPFGSVVTIPLSSASSEADLTEFANLVRNRHERVADEFQLTIEPEDKEKVEFGRVTIKKGDMDRLVLLTTVFAQSNTLEHYENVAVTLTEDSAALTEPMEQGRMPPAGQPMLKFIGKSLGIRRELVSQLSVLDPPEEIWEDDRLDSLYHALRNNFEIQQRMRVVEHKLELVKETADLVVSINESRRSLWLELIIIALIAIEIILYLVGH